MAAKTNTTITTDEIQHIITTLAEDYEAKHSIKTADSKQALLDTIHNVEITAIVPPEEWL